MIWLQVSWNQTLGMKSKSLQEKFLKEKTETPLPGVRYSEVFGRRVESKHVGLEPLGEGKHILTGKHISTQQQNSSH